MSGWPLRSLGELGTWHGGGTPSKQRPEYWADGNIPWLTPKDMGPDVITATRDHISTSAIAGSGAKLVPPGSVVVVVRSGILERTLPVAVVPFATTVNQDMKALQPARGVDPRWVAWAIRAQGDGLLRRTRKAGTTVASIDTRRFLSAEISLPSLDEQQRTVAILEDHLSRLDAATRDLQCSKDRLRSFAALWAEAIAEGQLVTLGSLAIHANYGTSTKCVVDGPGQPVVRIPNLRDGRVDLTDEKRAVDPTLDLMPVTLAAGDLLIVRTNGSRDLIGRVAVVQEGIEAAFASYLIRYRLDYSLVLPHWARFVLGTPSRRRQLEALAASSAGQYNLGLRKLDTVTIPAPSLVRQRELLRSVDSFQTSQRAIVAGVDAGLRRAGALRRSLLSAAFSGRLA